MINTGGKYDAGNQNNISIGNFIKQDVIVNFHMGNLGMTQNQNPNSINQNQSFLPKKEEGETIQLSPPNSGQAEIGMINSR